MTETVRNLLAAEFGRLLHRRFVQVALVLMVAAAGLLMLALAADAEVPSSEQRAAARVELADAIARHETLTAQCEQGLLPETSCQIGPLPTEDDFLPFMFRFTEEADTLLGLAALLLGLFGFFVGASFVGAEWTSGGMSNLLLWEPRRRLVLAAKLAAAVAGVTAVAVVFLAGWLGLGAATAAMIGAIGEFESGQVAELIGTAVRVVALAAGAAGAGFGLASVGRRTVVAPGAAVAYLVVYEIGLAIVTSVVGGGDLDWARLTVHTASWVQGGWDQIWEACDSGYCWTGFELTWMASGAVLATVVLALLAAAFIDLRRRDIP